MLRCEDAMENPADWGTPIVECGIVLNDNDKEESIGADIPW